MTYLLDTNTCIRFLNGRAPQIRVRLLAVGDEEIVVCSVVKAEMYTGSAKSQHPERSLAQQLDFLDRFPSLAFDDAAAAEYAQLRASLEKRGTPIGSNDMLIAAIALAHDLILVTHNTSEFGRISGLTLEDWEI